MKKPVIAVVGMLTLAVVGWVAVATRPAPPVTGGASPVVAVTQVPGRSPSAATSTPDPAAPSPSSVLVGLLPVTVDPDVYAAGVAGVVFGMDTRDVGPEGYRDLLLGEADPQLTPTGWEDLDRLVDERIPTATEWARMAANEQWSVFVAEQVWVPGSWEQVVIAGQAEPGWAVRNVTGVQTTHYTEVGTGHEAVRERTITIGMRCPAEGAGVERCHLVIVGSGVVS